MKKTKGAKKVAKVMREFKKGELNIGKSAKKVKSRKQAVAIALSEGLEWFLNRRHINEGDKLHAFVHFVHGHSVNWKFHEGICNPYPNVANSDKRRTLLVVCWMSRSTT